MKNKLSIICGLIAFASCQVAEIEPSVNEPAAIESEMVKYQVGMDFGVDTKTQLSDDRKIFWSDGDKMNIFAGINNDKKDKLVLVDGAGSQNGTFYGPYFAGENVDETNLHQTVIVYPYDENNTISADNNVYTVGLTIPAVQKYTEGTFANGAHPMIGVTETPKEIVISTKNVNAAIMIPLKGDVTVSKIVLSAEDENKNKKPLAGPATVVTSYRNNPVATVTPETASNTVTLDCGNGEAFTGVKLYPDKATEFHISFAPCGESVINARVYATDGTYMDIVGLKHVTDGSWDRNDYVAAQERYYASTGDAKVDLLKAAEDGGTYTLQDNLMIDYRIQFSKNMTLDLNGYTLKTTATANAGKGLLNLNGAKLEIKNGKIISTKAGYLFLIQRYATSPLILNNVKIEKTNSGDAVVYYSDGIIAEFTDVTVNTKGHVFYTNSGTKGEIVIDGGKYKAGSTKKIFYSPRGNVSAPVTFKSSKDSPMFSDKTYAGVAWNETGDAEYPWTPGGVYGATVNGVSYVNLQEAVNAAAAAGEPVVLKTNVTLDEPLVIGGATPIAVKSGSSNEVVIDLNGKTLATNEDTEDYSAAVIVYSGDVTIKNGTIASNGTAAHKYMGAVWVRGDAEANVTIEGGVFKGNNWAETAEGQTDCMATIYVSNPKGFVNINGGDFYCVQQAQVPEQNQILNYKNSFTTKNIVVKGGTFHGMNPAKGNGVEVSYVADGYSSVETSAGVFEVKEGIYTEEALKAAVAAGKNVTLGDNINISSAVLVTKDLTVDLNGKTLTSAGDGFEVTLGTLTLTGNGIVNAGTEGGNWVAVWANGGNAVIENGTFSVVSGKDGSTNDCIYAKGGQITVNGGTFSNAGTYYPNMGGVVINANNDVANSKVIINGGTFNPAEGCVAYEVADVEAGRIELNNAVVNESELKIAVAAGKNVKLGANINISSAVVVTKNLTVDLNGKTLTSAGDGFEVTAGTLTLTGNGTVNAGTEGGNWVAVWANGGNAVIENGTFSVVSGKDGSTNDCIYAKGGQITVNGGTFSNAGTYYPNMGGVVINANNDVANSKVIINGGTFNPAEGCVAYEVADVEAGRIELNNAVMNESELNIAVAAGKNVKLGANINISSAVLVTKDLTVDLNGKTLTSAGDGFEVTSGTLTLTGKGIVNAGTEGDNWVAVWANGGNAVINDGTYNVVVGKNGSTNDCIYAKGGNITINGGIFSNAGTYDPAQGGVVINANNSVANSKVIINGGTFNPAEGCVAYEVADVEAGRVILHN